MSKMFESILEEPLKQILLAMKRAGVSAIPGHMLEEPPDENMSDIYLPFLPRFEPAILSHVKTMTCRSKRMGQPGDTFTAFGQQFTLTQVFRTVLRYVAEDAYTEEGCESPGELMAVWASIHPRRGYEPERIVWAHCWK